MKAMRLSLVALVALALGLGALAGTHDPIKQGDFAVLLASELNQPVPPGGWTPENARPFLSGLGLAPISGTWTKDDVLNEGNLVHMLRVLGGSVFSARPDDQVTWGKAYAVLAEYRDMFRSFALGKTNKITTTTHIYTGVGGVAAGAPTPVSPIVP